MSPTPLDGCGTKNRFFGKYRGVVVENLDPMQIGRIQAQVPDVLGETPSGWALPCVLAAGIQAGCFVVPPVGSQVWVEFEQGDPDFPIWTGGFWGLAADVPIAALAPAPTPPGQNIVVQTAGQNALVLSDAPPSPAGGGVILSAVGGAMIIINDAGVTISNGKGATITLIGPTVSINSGALTLIGTSVTIDGAPLAPL
jgi:Type VI secretion system/phage-baseplate injector OB domain